MVRPRPPVDRDGFEAESLLATELASRASARPGNRQDGLEHGTISNHNP